jgi:chromosomal replication initiator protein
MDAWEQIKQKLSRKLPSESFQSWFVGTSFRSSSGERLFVSVPNLDTKDWIEKEHGDQVRSTIGELKLPYREVHYEVVSPPPTENGSPGGETNGVSNDSLFAPYAGQLNQRYTFDSFVVGSCNQFAHAAAKAVVERPAHNYNPLFIYGGVGMGKTHLIHAVGHEFRARSASLRIVYTTCERFVNQLVTCLRTDRMPLFHQYYRSADVLLVDDVHVLAGKERTQEEFFHTFNELYDHHKQIVLSSDTTPKNTPGLVERLRSRFEWGLMVDVQAPDLETKMAILDKKAEAEGVHLPNEVRVLIARSTKSNVRELEGALVKLIAYSSVTEAPITINMAKQVLRHLVGGSDKKVTIEAVVKAVADRFQIQASQLRVKSNEKRVAYPRQVAMFLAKELTQSSLPEIGRAFGGKHHTTVLHSIQKIDRMRNQNPDLNRLINSVMDSFN